MIDLDLAKDVVPSSPRIGEVVTFVIQVSNAVDALEATNVEVTDVVQPGFEFVPGSIGGGDERDVSGTTLRWRIYSIPPGSTVQLTFRARVAGRGPLTNFAEITGADQEDRDSFPSNGGNPDEDDDDTVAIMPYTPSPAPALGSWGMLAALLVLVGIARRRMRFAR